VAIKKLGVIGVQVKIIPPGSVLPDHFEIKDLPKEKQMPSPEIVVTPVGEDVDEEIDLDIEPIPEEEYLEER